MPTGFVVVVEAAADFVDVAVLVVLLVVEAVLVVVEVVQSLSCTDTAPSR